MTYCSTYCSPPYSAAEGNAIRASILEAIGVALSSMGGAPSEASLIKVKVAVTSYLLTEEDSALRSAASGCLHSLTAYLSADATEEFLCELVAEGSDASEWVPVVGALCGATEVLRSPSVVAAPETDTVKEAVLGLLEQCLTDDRTVVRTTACECIGSLLGDPQEALAALTAEKLAGKIGRASSKHNTVGDARKAAMVAVKKLAKHNIQVSDYLV